MVNYDSFIEQQKIKRERSNYVAWRKKDEQDFLASFFPPVQKKKLLKAKYDEQIVNRFTITKTYNTGRDDYFYEVFSNQRLLQKKRSKQLNQKLGYLPSTGGQQKYKTLRRKI